MGQDEISKLVRYITGLGHPPISYANPDAKWMKVHFYASGGVVSAADGFLRVPKYSSQLQLAAALLAAISLAAAPPS